MPAIDSDRAITLAAGPLDAILAAAYAVEPGEAAVAVMDDRFERVVRLGPAGIGRRQRRTRRATWLLAAAATLVVLGGAGSIALQRFEGWSAPDFDVAWERGAVLDLAESDGGYEVTLVRAYADGGQVILSVAVEDLERRPETAGVAGLTANGGSLVDDTGVEYIGMGGTAGPVDKNGFESAELWYFDPPVIPLEPGERHFTLTLDAIEVRDHSLDGTTPDPSADGAVEVPSPWHTVRGSWVFEFDLVVEGGDFVEPANASDTAAGVTVTVESLQVTPTRIRVVLAFEGARVGVNWLPVEVSAKRGTIIREFGSTQELGGGRVAMTDEAGLDDGSGAWTITVGQVAGLQEEDRIDGPWQIQVIVP